MKLLLFLTLLLFLKDNLIQSFDLNPNAHDNSSNFDRSKHGNSANALSKKDSSSENKKFSFESDPVFKSAMDNYLKNKKATEAQENNISSENTHSKLLKSEASSDKSAKINIKNYFRKGNSEKLKTETNKNKNENQNNNNNNDQILNSNINSLENNNKNHPNNKKITNVRTSSSTKRDSPGEYEDTNTFSIPYEIPKIQEKKKVADTISYDLDSKIIKKFKNIYNLLGQKADLVAKSDNLDLVRPKMQKTNNCNLNSIDFNLIRPVQTNPKCQIDEVYDPILRLCVNIDCIPVEDVNVAGMLQDE